MKIPTEKIYLDSQGREWEVITWCLIVPDDQMALVFRSRLGLQVTIREDDIETYFKEKQ